MSAVVPTPRVRPVNVYLQAEVFIMGAGLQGVHLCVNLVGLESVESLGSLPVCVFLCLPLSVCVCLCLSVSVFVCVC